MSYGVRAEFIEAVVTIVLEYGARAEVIEAAVVIVLE